MIGTVDYVRRLGAPRASEAAYAIIVADGRRFFGPPTECPRELARGDRVEFDPDVHADPRGPIACRVRVLARAASPAPETLLPDAVITCLDCGVPFTWSSAETGLLPRPERRTRTAGRAQ